MIQADAVTVRRNGRVLLEDVSVTVPTGSVTGIVGPNGSGKTTLLRTLVRAVPLSTGRVRVDGHDIRTRSRRWIARRMAEVGQRLEPDPALRVIDEVALGGLAEHGVLRSGAARRDRRTAEAVEAVGLSHRALDPLATLSGGELQRVALARAINQGADHVLLDEPTNHLDIRHRLEIVALLRLIAPTVVVVLHDLELAAEVCDHLVVLHRGHIAGCGAPADLLGPDLLDPVYEVASRRLPDPSGRVRLDFTLPPDVRRPPTRPPSSRIPTTTPLTKEHR